MIKLPTEKGHNEDPRVNMANLVKEIVKNFDKEDLIHLNECCKDKNYSLSDVISLDENILKYIFIHIIDEHFFKYIMRYANIRQELKKMKNEGSKPKEELITEYTEIRDFITSYGY